MEGEKVYFDGYKAIGEESLLKEEFMDFTISFDVTPFTYESVFSGLIDNIDFENKKGLRVLIGKRGCITVDLFAEANLITLCSEGFIKYRKKNHVTFSCFGTAGWCDLCINGHLAARKQFKRFGKISFSKNKFILGRNLTEPDIRRGFFHGKFDNFKCEEGYIPYLEVIKNQGCEETLKEEIDLYKDALDPNEIYRTRHHLQPVAKWMNEPHAPVFFNGHYHIFYQANPHGPIWDNLCWGHLVSSDMVNWKDAGIALDPDDVLDGVNDIDPDGCWSGSAGLDLNGNPIIFYTAGNNNYIPNQAVAIATPLDTKDPELKKWIKQGVVIRQPLDMGFLGEFRDPFLFKRGDNYYVLVGTGDANNGGGNALVYTSKNLKSFKPLGFLMDYDFEDCKEAGHVWELPVMLPLCDNEGKHVKDILLLCACQVENERVETYYFIGRFDENAGKFISDSKKASLIDLGYGIFTGPSGFVTPDGRSVVFTIAQGHRKPEDEFNAGWAHCGGMPVELGYDKGNLTVSPIREVFNYLGNEEMYISSEYIMEGYFLIKGKKDELSVSFDYDKDSLEVSYCISTNEFKAVRKNDGKIISKCRGDIDKVFIKEEMLELEIIIDHSLIEIYLNRQKSMTLRCYEYEQGYRVKCDNGTVSMRRFIHE